MRLWESSVMNVIHRRFVRRTRKKNNKKMYITLVCQCTRGGSLAGKWSFMPQHWTHIAPFLSASLSVCHPQQLLPFVHNLHHSLVYCVCVCACGQHRTYPIRHLNYVNNTLGVIHFSSSLTRLYSYSLLSAGYITYVNITLAEYIFTDTLNTSFPPDGDECVAARWTAAEP